MEKAMKEVRFSEIRALQNDNPNSDEMIIEGYAAVFETEADLGWCTEIIDRNAFSGCDMQDVCMKYNHEDNFLILARTRNQSLQLTVDNKGLKVRAKLIDTTNNRDIYKMIKEGLLDKMSFAFVVKKREYDYENDIRRITAIDKLFDVSVVDVPAYDSTEINARSKNEYEKEKAKYLEEKNKRKRLKMEIEMLSL